MFRPLKPFQLSMDIAAAVVFFALTGLLQFPANGSFSGWGVVVSLAMAGALAVRRLSPTLALGIAWAGAILQMAMGLNPMPSNLAILAVLYVTAAYGSRVVFWLGFASSLVGALVITLYLFLATAFLSTGLNLESLSVAAATWIAATFALLLSWTVGALVRTALRARENRAAQEVAEADAAAEQERVRIARDMHDVVAHSLAVVIAQADGARYAAASDPEAATTALGTISTTARAALADVRLLLTQLRHSQSEGPQPTLADLEGLYAQVRAAGVGLQVEVDPVPMGEPPASVQLAVFRILQEALTNAMRHGDGGPVSVSLSWLPDRVELVVRNAAHGSQSTEPFAGDPVARGHGLIGMRERAQLVGGRLEAGPEAGAFVVRATLPIGAT
ncbi:histidine kinase [Microbacterium sp. Root61]|uniref:sensor histidine kinase n=1 Tax=Microbacterium sp. Root61 TaxID=1736570 RepID=UPI0006F6CA5C|nr:histidine kinase [Microbacterium sp. Root61]KRA25605.1 histidine kinase [Microbacterium sp. Root61]